MKKKLTWLIVLLMTFAFVGCSQFEKEYSASGITVTMEAGFVKRDVANLQFCMQTAQVMFAGNGESKVRFPVDTRNSLLKYVETVLSVNSLTVEAKETTINGKKCYSAIYEKEIEGVFYKYYIVMLEGVDKFYTINFASESKRFDKLLPKFEKWAMTLRVE